MLLDRIAEIGVALFIAGALFIIVLGVFSNVVISSIEARINNLTVECSENPIPDAIKISLADALFYCLVREKRFGENDYDHDYNLGFG